MSSDMKTGTVTGSLFTFSPEVFVDMELINVDRSSNEEKTVTSVLSYVSDSTFIV